MAAAPSLALGPRRRSLLGFGRILIYRNVGGPIAVESAYRVDAQKLAVLLIDCDRHALRQEGAISLRNLGRSKLFQRPRKRSNVSGQFFDGMGQCERSRQRIGH